MFVAHILFFPHETGFAPNPYGGFLSLGPCQWKYRISSGEGQFMIGCYLDKRVFCIGILWKKFGWRDFNNFCLQHCPEKIPTRAQTCAHIFGDDIFPDGQNLSDMCPFHHENTKTSDGMTKRDKDLFGPVTVFKKFCYLGSSAVPPSSISLHLPALVDSTKAAQMISTALAADLVRFIDNHCGMQGIPRDQHDSKRTNAVSRWSAIHPP